MKIKIESFREYDGYNKIEYVKIWNGDELMGEGYYGGEPEDNMRGRTYQWVEPLIAKIVESLGHEVETVKMVKE